MNKIRLDKFLWITRIYKTRSLSIQACKKNKISINDVKSKPSKLIKTNDTIKIQKNYIEYQYRVIDLPKSRISAKEVNLYIKDLTLQIELDKLKDRKTNYSIQFKREKGIGRPTKKDRRIMDEFLNRND